MDPPGEISQRHLIYSRHHESNAVTVFRLNVLVLLFLNKNLARKTQAISF